MKRQETRAAVLRRILCAALLSAATVQVQARDDLSSSDLISYRSAEAAVGEILVQSNPGVSDTAASPKPVPNRLQRMFVPSSRQGATPLCDAL
jgi:hypothetical protein